MPIITNKNGYYPYEEVIFVGPDESGTYFVENSVKVEGIPTELDPLEVTDIVSILGEVKEEEPDKVTLDYSDVSPQNSEQVLKITGLKEVGLYNSRIMLNIHGNGGIKTKRPKPMPQEGEIHVYGRPVREIGMWRRKRENDDRNKAVIGWETNEEYMARKISLQGKER